LPDLRVVGPALDGQQADEGRDSARDFDRNASVLIDRLAQRGRRRIVLIGGAEIKADDRPEDAREDQENLTRMGEALAEIVVRLDPARTGRTLFPDIGAARPLEGLIRA
jgi:hypothetical protein